MSGLAALLAGHGEPAVRRWAGVSDPDDVRHTVEHAGWAFGYVDGWTTGGSRPEVLAAMGRALDFGAHYGRNLDALADCLRDLPAERGTLLLWDGWSVLARADERGFALVLRVLSERCADPVAGPFAVLLRGEGPELAGVPLLD
jgi:RNAse (barnase) inhibitor barstar